MTKTHNNFLDYDEKVLPSITHETLKSVIANFDASSLLTKRNEVSFFVNNLVVKISLGVAQNQRWTDWKSKRLPNHSRWCCYYWYWFLTTIHTGKYSRAGLEQRGNFLFSLLNKNKLPNSKHFKPNTLSKKLNRPNKKRLLLPRETLKGKFHTMNSRVSSDLWWPPNAVVNIYFSARLIGKSLKENPAYLKLQRIEYGKQISKYVAQGGNKVMLPSNNLLLDIQTPHTQYDKKQ